MTSIKDRMDKLPMASEREWVVESLPPGIQRVTDRAVTVIFLWAFPRWIRPNHLTFVRFLLIPAVIVLLALHLDWWGLGVFIAATCTDFIDGAMARTRSQITVLGTYIDPIADKLLVAATLAYVGHDYLVVRIMLAFIVIELILTAIGARVLIRYRKARPANAYGKVKMALQSVALYLFLLGGILEYSTWMKIGSYLLWPALGLAFLSGVNQMRGVSSTKKRAMEEAAKQAAEE
jgi:CDP-diacylglycerol--glycerol-3-phosphate 3-phosphatidyltransferase